MAIDEGIGTHRHGPNGHYRSWDGRRVTRSSRASEHPAPLARFERAVQRLAAASANAALEVLVEEAVQLSHAEQAEVWLRRGEQELQCVVSGPDRSTEDTSAPFSVVPHAAEALARHTAVYVHAASSDGHGPDHAGNHRAAWIVPLVAGDQGLGVLRVCGAASDPELGSLLFALAAHAATILQAQRDAQVLAVRYGSLVNVAAHDLRNVITSLKGYAYLVERYLAEQADERPGRWAALVSRQVNAMAELLAGLVEVGRVASGRRVLEPERLDLRALVQQAVVTSQVPDLRLELPTVPANGEWDAARLTHAIAWALRSALRTTDPPATLRLEPSTAGPILLLCPGSTVEEPPAATTWCETADLPLYVARALVEAHGGQMTCWQTAHGTLAWRIELPWSVPAAPLL